MNTKNNVKKIHSRLVRDGMYGPARSVLRLLKNGRVSLGLNDNDFLADIALSNGGLTCDISRRTYSAVYVIKHK